MNLKRGLLRLWMIGSALFIMIVAAASYVEIRDEFETASSVGQLTERLARLRAAYYGPDGDMVRLNEFRAEYPQYDDMSDTELASALHKKLYSEPIEASRARRAAAWTEVWTAVAIALGFPLAILGLGFALGWALAGFRQRTSN